MTALAQAVNVAGKEAKADVCLYDVGPNVGALNRTVLLDCDYFIAPVAPVAPVSADLFSLRALSTVGVSLGRWIRDWQTVLSLADAASKKVLFRGKPGFAGYVTSAFKVSSGGGAANPHADWEKRIAPRIRDRVVAELKAVDPSLVPSTGGYKLGAIKHFHSLAPAAQTHGVAIGKLKGLVNNGHTPQIEEAQLEFRALAAEICKRVGI